MEVFKEDKSEIETEQIPLSGFLTKSSRLIATLTSVNSPKVEEVFRTKENSSKREIGLILTHTKMNLQNPTLREWNIVTIRNICFQSELIRQELQDLEKIDLTEQAKDLVQRYGLESRINSEKIKFIN